MGEAPEHIVLVETEEDVDALEVADPDRVAYISQTTLSVDETRAIIDRLRERFPNIVGPRTDDICYATTNRQAAVKQMAAECDLVLVIGSQNSSNSKRLVDVARDYGADAHLIDNEGAGARRSGSRARASSASPPARARPRSSSSASSSSSATAGPRTSRSSRSSTRTSASCCPKTIRARRLRPARAPRPRRGTLQAMDGLMMDYPLLVRHIAERAETVFGDREIVARTPGRRSSARPTREVVERARRLASALRELGIGPGDRVATFGVELRCATSSSTSRCRAWARCCTRSTSACSRTTCATSSATPRTG